MYIIAVQLCDEGDNMICIVILLSCVSSYDGVNRHTVRRCSDFNRFSLCNFFLFFFFLCDSVQSSWMRSPVDFVPRSV